MYRYRSFFLFASMRHSPLTSKQRSKNLYPSLTLLMLLSSQSLFIFPKHVLMFLIPTTKIPQRIGVTHRRCYISALTSIHMMQHSRNHFLNPVSQLLRTSLLSSTTTSEDSDMNNVATSTTPEKSEKSSEDIDAVQAAREARKYV